MEKFNIVSKVKYIRDWYNGKKSTEKIEICITGLAYIVDTTRSAILNIASSLLTSTGEGKRITITTRRTKVIVGTSHTVGDH